MLPPPRGRRLEVGSRPQEEAGHRPPGLPCGTQLGQDSGRPPPPPAGAPGHRSCTGSTRGQAPALLSGWSCGPGRRAGGSLAPSSLPRPTPAHARGGRTCAQCPQAPRSTWPPRGSRWHQAGRRPRFPGPTGLTWLALGEARWPTTQKLGRTTVAARGEHSPPGNGGLWALRTCPGLRTARDKTPGVRRGPRRGETR